ncbi:MAG: hypothetical protein H0T15_03980 [Thermoleophilaceae bacterium]|nr:hypothetical protein [Thermoleophilaceae bacterium]
MNSFHLVGVLLAVWAVLLAGLGIARDSFPATAIAERLVALITLVLVAGAIGTAIYTAAHHEDEGEDGVGDEAALVVR